MISQYTKQGYHGINQDACGFLEYDGKVIMAVADGHGHYLHFRSDIGSYLAVESFIDCFKETTSQKEDLIQREKRVQKIWVKKVNQYHKEHFVSSFEWVRARKYAQAYIDEKIPLEIAYGSTLLGAIHFKEENKLFLFRIGDGEMIRISLFHQEELLKKNDYGDENITESICEVPVKIKDNLNLPSFEKGLKSRDVLLLSSDGLSKFKNKKEIIFKLRKDINKLESYLSTLDNTDDLSVIVYRL